MIYDPLIGKHYCLDPWCQNPDPDLIPESVCGCHILTDRELEERKQAYLLKQEAPPASEQVSG